MNITDGKGVLESQLAYPAAVRGGAASTVAGAAAPAADRVSVSDAARDLVRLRAAARDDDPGAADRVAALRAAVASGQYRVDPTVVARSVLRELVSEHVH